MKRSILALLALLTIACGPVPKPPSPPSPPPVPDYTFGIVVCGEAEPAGVSCKRPIEGATVSVAFVGGRDSKVSNGDGFTSWVSHIPVADVRIEKDGYLPFAIGILPPSIDHTNVQFVLTRNMPDFPTRDEILQVRLTFQGLMVQTQQFGLLPWFEAALPWLSQADRNVVYAAKHASPAWGPAGDSHIIINLPSGPPLYDEPGQPYSADRFGPLDWTNVDDGRLADLVVDAAQAGFNKQLLFLGGDAGQAGFPIAMAQLETTYEQLRRGPKYGDLGGFVVVLPGWDGVFYGYTPDQVAAWGAKCRSLFVYCGIEHQPGRIPVGEGGSDYLPGGRMTTFDLILAELDGPKDSAWRTQRTLDAQGRPDYPGNQIWQIGARMLGPLYRRPGDQPTDSDSSAPPFYLAPQSPRGPFVHCAFEWVGEYNFVREWETTADEQRSREYFQHAGWTCGG